jgi:hypothetical protein
VPGLSAVATRVKEGSQVVRRRKFLQFLQCRAVFSFGRGKRSETTCSGKDLVRHQDVLNKLVRTNRKPPYEYP